MSLQEEIDSVRAEIKTDGYPMSIGEWLNMYESDELDIHPEFQRFFRWSPEQKSKLIESILLGIPIPPIFVAQRKDGVWDVVDGLQRLSTIFQFVGVLKNEDGSTMPALQLERTKYLPSLAGMKWEDDDDPAKSFTSAQRLFVKRSKIGASIIERESDELAKFELFMRLNTGGSLASDQEVRNCILVMLNRSMYGWLRDLSSDENFKECVVLTDRAIDEQYDLELVLRFVVFRSIDEGLLSNIGDVNDFMTDRMQSIAMNADFDYEAEGKAFRRAFGILAATTKSDSFRRYDSARSRFIGGFLVSAFEAVALGIGYNELGQASEEYNTAIEQKVKSLWSNDDFRRYSGSGIRASTRIPRVVPLGRRLFS